MGPGRVVRLIATDLDGTLVDRDLVASPRNRAAIAAATEAGVAVVAATGRGFRSAARVLEQVPEITVAVCANGAIVRDLAADVTWQAWPIDPPMVRKVHDEIARVVPGAAMAWESLDGSFRANQTYLDLRPDVAERWPDALVDDHPSEAVLKVLVRDAGTDEHTMLARLEPELPATVVATFSGFETVEITGDRVHKARGVSWLCERWGIDREATMAVGDSRNDIELLRWVGDGVAMGHAEDLVRRAADRTTADIAGDGLAVVIEGLLSI